MGQAKARGSYEQRKAEGEAKREIETRKREDKRIARAAGKKHILQALAVALAVGPLSK